MVKVTEGARVSFANGELRSPEGSGEGRSRRGALRSGSSSCCRRVDGKRCGGSFAGQEAEGSPRRLFVPFCFLINTRNLRTWGKEIGLLIRRVFSGEVLRSEVFSSAVNGSPAKIGACFPSAKSLVIETVIMMRGINTFAAW